MRLRAMHWTGPAGSGWAGDVAGVGSRAAHAREGHCSQRNSWPPVAGAAPTPGGTQAPPLCLSPGWTSW